jgi:phosphoglycolate phosphatase-like HAD superfamily hydrolase
MTIVFFDLDGPLVDVSERYVRLHGDVLRELGAMGMEAGIYWERKRGRVSEEDILKELGLGRLALKYTSSRLARIESTEYLAYDRAWPWATDVLGSLQKDFRLVLVTVRARRDLLLGQLENLNLAGYFHEILSEAAATRVHEQKAALMRDFCRRHELTEPGHWMVGDTEADVGAGQLLGFRTAAVLCGIRSRELLADCRPGFLLEDIRELPLLGDEKSQVRVKCGGIDAGLRLQYCRR